MESIGIPLHPFREISRGFAIEVRGRITQISLFGKAESEILDATSTMVASHIGFPRMPRMWKQPTNLISCFLNCGAVTNYSDASTRENDLCVRARRVNFPVFGCNK